MSSQSGSSVHSKPPPKKKKKKSKSKRTSPNSIGDNDTNNKTVSKENNNQENSALPQVALEQRKHISLIGRTVRTSGTPLMEYIKLSNENGMLLIRQCPCKLLVYLLDNSTNKISVDEISKKKKSKKKDNNSTKNNNTWLHISTICFTSDIVTINVGSFLQNTLKANKILIGTYDGEIFYIDADKIGSDNISYKYLDISKEQNKISKSLGIIRGIVNCNFLYNGNQEADSQAILITSLLEPMYLCEFKNENGIEIFKKNLIPQNNVDSIVSTTYIMSSSSNPSFFSALFGPNMALSRGNNSIAIQGYLDGSLRYVLLQSDYIMNNDSSGGISINRNVASIHGLLLHMPDNETILNILPIYSFFDDDVTDNNNSNQTTNTIKGLVIIGKHGTIKIISYFNQSQAHQHMDVDNENVLNNANLVKCGNHAVVETWPNNIGNSISCACIVNGYLVCISNRKTLVMPLLRLQLSPSVNNITNVQLPLARNVVFLQPLEIYSNTFIALTSRGLLYEFTMPSNNNIQILKRIENFGAKHSQGTRISADADSETRVKGLLEQLSEISTKEYISKEVSNIYTKQLSVLSEMLHWIVEFNHLFVSGKAFASTITIDQNLIGQVSTVHTLCLTLTPFSRNTNIYFPISDTWQIVVKIKHSQSGALNYIETKSIFLKDLAVRKPNDNSGQEQRIWRFPIELESIEPLEISVSLCTMLSHSKTIRVDDDGNAKNTSDDTGQSISLLKDQDAIFLPISSHLLDILDFAGLHNTRVTYLNNLNRVLKQSINNISLTSGNNGIISVVDGENLNINEHGPITQVGFGTRAKINIVIHPDIYNSSIDDDRSSRDESAGKLFRLKNILGKLIERPGHFSKHFTWRQNKNSKQIEVTGSLGRGHGISLLSSWCEESNSEATTSKTNTMMMPTTSASSSKSIKNILSVEILCEHPLDLPLIREALIRRGMKYNCHINISKNSGEGSNDNVTNDGVGSNPSSVSIDLEKDLFEIENELLILQKEQHGLESNCIDPNSNLSGVKSAPPFNIALYSARTSELAKKVAKLYLKLRKED